MMQDLLAVEDIPAWCRMVEHEFLGSEPHENHTSYYIKKGGESDSVEDNFKAAEVLRKELEN